MAKMKSTWDSKKALKRMARIVKIQDAGNAPLDGRQEQYWNQHIKPKYQRYRPGIDFEFIPQEVLLKRFDIAAFEYGHWTTQNDRLDFLASCQASLSDMQKVTGFKSIGFKKVGIAYGARGKGGRAIAHFEPWSFMINLTKERGFGSFAHEYGHAIDYFFGGHIERSSSTVSLSGGSSTATLIDLKDYKAGSLRYMMADLLKSIIWVKDGQKSESYQRLSQKADSDYWFRHTEIFARTFEQFVQYELAKNKVVNVFLTKSKYEGWRYLTAEDYQRIYPKMKKLISAIAKITKS